jgi:hypothetical protein
MPQKEKKKQQKTKTNKKKPKEKGKKSLQGLSSIPPQGYQAIHTSDAIASDDQSLFGSGSILFQIHLVHCFVLRWQQLCHAVTKPHKLEKKLHWAARLPKVS